MNSADAPAGVFLPARFWFSDVSPFERKANGSHSLQSKANRWCFLTVSTLAEIESAGWKRFHWRNRRNS